MDKYIDSRGAEMDPMSWSEALETVLSLARDNQISESHTRGDDALDDVRMWQEGALSCLETLLAAHSGGIDSFEMAAAASDWSESVWKADRSMDPEQPAGAIRICYDLAWGNALDPHDAARDVELADEVDRQQQAFDLVRDLLGMHGEKLSDLAASATPSGRP